MQVKVTLKILLKRSNMCTDEVGEYLNRAVNSCCDFSETHEPQKTRNVSISSVNRSFNETICIDHLGLKNFRIFQPIDESTRC